MCTLQVGARERGAFCMVLCTIRDLAARAWEIGITFRRIGGFAEFVHLQTRATGAIVSADFSVAFF
jgi:hypothetical protein